MRVDRRRDAAGEEPFDDLDQVDHRVADMAVLVGIEAVRLDHQRAGADQQVAEAGTRADARMAVMRRVAGGEEAGLLVLAIGEHAIPRHEHVVEHDDARYDWPYFGRRTWRHSRPVGRRAATMIVTPSASTGTAQHTA